jgi:UDP-glucuronate decarboxylase
MICQALSNNPITIYGEGNQSRSFCYVSDLIDGLVRLFFAENIGSPINLGNPDPRTMNQLAREIVQLTNSKSKLVHLELPGDDPQVREPEITKAREVLGWSPQVSLEQGLIQTIEYFSSLRSS